MWKEVLIGLGAAVALSWLALVVALLLVRPKGNVLREALRILPATPFMISRGPAS